MLRHQEQALGKRDELELTAVVSRADSKREQEAATTTANHIGRREVGDEVAGLTAGCSVSSYRLGEEGACRGTV